MDKKIVGLVGVISGLASLGVAQATPITTELPKAQSFAELLEPIPNAAALLRVADAAAAARESQYRRNPNVKLVYDHHHHNYHHHHHPWWWYQQHHHHHHNYHHHHHHNY
jgi:hypothetical protein